MPFKQQNEDAKMNTDTPCLLELGWTPHFQAQLDRLNDDTLRPARVTGVRKNSFLLNNGKNEWRAGVAGKLQHRRDTLYPVAGDWVLAADNLIVAVLERRNALSRGAAGTHGQAEATARHRQVIAANLDTVLIVCGLDRDFNLRRIERYLTLVYNCGLIPVIVLTKADLHTDPAPFVDEVEAIAFGVPIHPLSALDNRGLDPLAAYFSPGQTCTLVGSSGAGKSTLVNRLCGKPLRATGSVSASQGKGRHITTTRDLIVLPRGGMVIDNPGLREVAFWDAGGGIASAFPEIETLAASCRFGDCQHGHEPGCRVLEALAEGDITPERLENYRKMQRELTYLAHRQQKSADRLEKERWKEVALKIKALKRQRRPL